jgi:presenilin-like A22 family membrane protease
MDDLAHFIRDAGIRYVPMVLVALGIYALAARVARNADGIVDAAEIEGPRSFRESAVRAVSAFLVLTSILAGTVWLIEHTDSLAGIRTFLFAALSFMIFRFITPFAKRLMSTPVKTNVWAATVTALITAPAAFRPNWATENAFTLVVIMMLLVLFRKVPTKVVLAIFAGLMLYDVVGVFVTGQMIELADGAVKADLPLLLQIPSGLALNSPPATVLGAGDVIIPGLLVMVAAREAQRTGIALLKIATLAGYAVGLACAYVALTMSESPQPALIYLVPCTTAALLLTAWRTGTLKEVLDSPRKDGIAAASR